MPDSSTTPSTTTASPLPPLSALAIQRARALWRHLAWQLLPEAFVTPEGNASARRPAEDEALPHSFHAPLLAMVRTLHNGDVTAAQAQRAAAEDTLMAALAQGPITALGRSADAPTPGRLDLALDLLDIAGRTRLVAELIAATTLDAATAQAARVLAERLGHGDGALSLYDDALSVAGLGPALASRSCATDGALCEVGAVAVHDAAPRLSGRLLDFLDGERTGTSPLDRHAVHLQLPEDALPWLAETRAGWIDLLRRAMARRRPVLLSGPAGFGGAALARLIADEEELGFRTVALPALIDAETSQPAELFATFHLEARLGADVWALHHLEQLDPDTSGSADSLTRLAGRLLAVQRPIVVINEGPLAPSVAARLAGDGGFLHIDVPALDADQRQDLLRRAFVSHGLTPSAATDLALEARHFHLDPAPIYMASAYAMQRAQQRTAAARLRGALADADGTNAQAPEELATPTFAELRAACSTAMTHRLAAYGSRVTTTLTWDDVILDEDTLKAVRNIGRFAKARDTIFDTWEFGRKMPYGRALSALFSGPSGTGKTMVAGLVAQDLGVELYRVDLGRVVSKYIGETEARLDALFSEAAQVGCALLFDEADALFAQRTQVQSSNDRYANLEVNYLLQRLESFDGVVILTTNFATSIDEAFVRRLRFRVVFPFPTPEQRASLWEHMFPAALPMDDDGIDFAWLGENFELAGGHIRNATLRSAMLAASAGEPLSMRMVYDAAAAEYHELGKLAPPYPFDEEDWY